MTESRPASTTANEGYTRRLTTSFMYFGTVLVSQVLSFLILPFITRALPPEVYGSYALALAISSLVSMIATAWMRNVALAIYFERDALERTRGFFLGLAALQAGAFSALYLSTLGVMLLLGRDPEDLRILISAGVMVLVSDLAVLATTLLRAERRAMAFGAAEAGGAVLRFGLTLLGLSLGFKTAELLFDAASVGYIIAAVIAVWALWPKLKGPARIDREGLREVVGHGPAALPFSVADWTERLADRLIVEGFLGSAALGIYSIGYTIGERTIGALSRGVFMMAWPNILESFNKSGTAATALAIREAQVLYVWFTLGPTVFLMAYGPALLEWFAGSDYTAASTVVPIVAASMWLGGLATYWNRHMEMRKNFGTLSFIRLVGAVFNVALNFVLVPRYGIIGAAWSTMGNRVLNATIFYFTRDSELVTIPTRTLFLAGILSVALWTGTGFMPATDLLKGATFVVIYGAIALIVLWRSALGGARES